MADLERTLRPALERAAKGFRVILLNGQRQVGKTTLLRNMTKGTGRGYVSLDDMNARKLAQTDPELFIQQYPPPLIIDEVQYAPELFPYIKIHVDEHREKKGAFWLTGSQKYRLMQGVRESLVGRIAIFDLMGLSYREKTKRPFLGKPFIPTMDKAADPGGARKPSVRDLYKRIWEGGLPEPFVDKNVERDRYYSSYVQSYIERNVRDFYKIEKPLRFFDFTSVVAAQTGQLLNYSSIARDIGISVKTAQAWMGILERSGLVYLLHPYSPNITNRIIKTPKMYFLDTGLCAYLTKWLTPESLMNGAMSGAILETYTVGELLKSYLHNGLEPTMWMYRDANQNEVDIVLEQDGTLHPVEIKKTMNPGTADCKSFGELAKLKKKVGLGAILCLKPERMAISRDAVSIPVWEI